MGLPGDSPWQAALEDLMKLIVGLGNPGKKYESTRHNIGFDVLRRFAERHGASPGRDKFDGELQECTLPGERVLLLKPQTFMNLSGRSVRQAIDFYKIAVDDLLIVCDDFNLPLGTLRMRRGGSDGGQKGLADTIRHLATEEFARLRIGIGPVPEHWDAADFVLSKFSPAETKLLEQETGRACEAIETWITEGIAAAMNRYNGSRPTE